MHRQWVQTACQLDKNTRRDLRDLNERLASDALHNINITDETRQDVANLHSMFHELRLACPTLSNLRRRDVKLRSEIEQRRLVSDQQLKGLQTSIENCEGIFQQHVMMFTRQIEELRTDLDQCHQEHLGFAGSSFGRSNGFNALSGDEKYNKVGKNLYSTLSDRLHKYGHQQGEACLGVKSIHVCRVFAVIACGACSLLRGVIWPVLARAF
ncbi:hypothetical protein HBI28_206760 [Parastagonospora nodorum]|nr:hypothetical protein HBI28_206760 [Parastagonospora nodorum]